MLVLSVVASLVGSIPARSAVEGSGGMITSREISLDGSDWMIAADPNNVGKTEQWWQSPRTDAKATEVPKALQTIFPGYNGAAWYWREITVPTNPHAGGRYLLRFWDVDYYADVWVNGKLVGSHEGLQCPFSFDITDAVRAGKKNRIAVRVLYPGGAAIDGFTHGQTAHSWSYAHPGGGILDSIELVIVPAVWIEDLRVIPDPKTGKISIEANVRNAGAKVVRGGLELFVAAAQDGACIDSTSVTQELKPGDTLVKTQLRVTNPKLWNTADPYLYRVAGRVTMGGSASIDESSTRCGFRDFRFENGYFRLNGKRIFVRCAHQGPEGAEGVMTNADRALVLKEFATVKAMGFNMVRFIGRAPLRCQLEVADEMGLMVYEESSAAWMFHDSPKMGERFDRQVDGMIRRDRNHPSVVIWGLLNETGDGPVFQHAAKMLPLVRSLDDTRMVMLASGRFDAIPGYTNGLEIWKPAQGTIPSLVHNPMPHAIYAVPLWPTDSITLNPGGGGEYSVARWTAPATGEYAVSAEFRGTGAFSTSDVHLLAGGKSVYDGFINSRGWGDLCEYEGTVKLAVGETLDLVVGNAGSPSDVWTDITQVECTIKSSDGTSHDLAEDFSIAKNPSGPWSYGWLKAGPAPDSATFTAYAKPETMNFASLGGISNPGSKEWEDPLRDFHTYPRVPHRQLEIERLRTASIDNHPLFLSEYGIGSGVNWPRHLLQMESLGMESNWLANRIRGDYNALLGEWKRLKLDEAFPSPEDYFDKCIAKMGGQRKMGVNALRSNPRIVGYSQTGMHDPAAYGEGTIDVFRDAKPNSFDSQVDAFAPLRWCLFAEPVNAYRGQKVKLEAVISNEDVLKPGDYPARLQVLGPNDERIWEREVMVTIPAGEPPYAIPVFSDDVQIDGPTGKYRLTARLLKGGGAYGESVEFYVTDASDMPEVKTEVVLWGEDQELAERLEAMGVKAKPFTTGDQSKREVILVSGFPGGKGDAAAWRELAEHIARGSTAIFLSLDVFAKDGNPMGWLPAANKGTMGAVSEYTFPQLYNRDEWAKPHPIFAGLPTGVMDYTFYREIIPDVRFWGQDTPDEAVAGAFRTSMGYVSEQMLSVYKLGSGRYILNALRVRQALGQDPTAEHLLRNMLNYAARDAAKPVEPLPGDFESFLKVVGY